MKRWGKKKDLVISAYVSNVSDAARPAPSVDATCFCRRRHSGKGAHKVPLGVKHCARRRVVQRLVFSCAGLLALTREAGLEGSNGHTMGKKLQLPRLGNSLEEFLFSWRGGAGSLVLHARVF